MTQILFEWRVDGALVDAEDVDFANQASTFGIRRTDTNEVLVAAGTPIPRTGPGQYEYPLTDPVSGGLIYEYYIRVLYEGETYYIQNFQEQGGEGEGVARIIRAMFLDVDGTPIEPSPAPELSSPTMSYGAKRLSDGATVIPAGTEMALVGDGYYAAYLTSADESSRYRFYVHAVIDNISYYLPGVTNGQSWSVALTLGRYTDSYRIGQMIGHDNLYLWAGTPQYGTAEADEPVDFATRLSEFIRSTENRLDEELFGTYVNVPFTVSIPQTIRDLATTLVAVAIYESRGVDDTDGEGPAHRLSGAKRQAMKDIRRIKLGLLRVADIGYSGPAFGYSETGLDD